MARSFQADILDPGRFVVTVELVPGSESRGPTVDAAMTLAREALDDGRVSAVSITDNPGGNPALSPDALGREIRELGMDVIVHFTCRDMNRAGMESRALQLSRMGLTHILALNGDYVGKGFGGQGAPVFDLDSVNLICMLSLLGERTATPEQPHGFFVGCAVSPFKSTEAECYAQYAKLCKKVGAGARFVITQVGYDARKFREVLQVRERFGISIPVLGSVYVLTGRTARIMNRGKIPGVVVTDRLLERVNREWENPERGREEAVERAARLGAVLKGLGYRGIHIGGAHHSFALVRAILDRMEAIESRWREFLEDFRFPQPNGYYLFPEGSDGPLSAPLLSPAGEKAPPAELALFLLLRSFHRAFFSFDSPLESFLADLCGRLDRSPLGRAAVEAVEDPAKKVLLSCRKCGDCGIRHLAFLCPVSQCPKHIRNGACGGSTDGWCEVRPDRLCVWVRAYRRLASVGETELLARGCVPPRRWELDNTSSWLNFHLRRDHQSVSCAIASACSAKACAFKPA